jgi:hypothetical protein
MRNQVDQIGRDLVSLKAKMAAYEEAKKWTGAERRRVARELETGDHTFRAIRQEIADAYAKASQAVREVGAMREALAKKSERPKGFWPMVKKKAIEAFIPFALSTIGAAIVSAGAWLYYHFAFLAKLAESSKNAGGHP